MVFNLEQRKSAFEILANIYRVFKSNVDRIKWSKDWQYSFKVNTWTTFQTPISIERSVMGNFNLTNGNAKGNLGKNLGIRS